MNKSNVAAVALSLSLLIGGTARANEIWCSGTVANVLMYKNGQLMVVPSFRNDYLTVCNVQSTWNEVDSTVCWGWYSTLMAAKKAGKTVTIFYSDPAATACSTLATYGSSPAPAYVMINDQ